MVRNVKSNHTASLRFKAHLAFPQCLPSILKCQKSLQAHPTPTHGQKDNAAKIKDRLRNDKNGQLVTRYIKNWAYSTKNKVFSSHITLYGLTGSYSEMPNFSYTHPSDCLKTTATFTRFCFSSPGIFRILKNGISTRTRPLATHPLHYLLG
jgi:hypothetical protein